MKPYLIALLLFMTCGANAQNTNSEYDPALAKKLNADEMGMKKYFFVILKTGIAQVPDKAANDSIFAGHFKNIQRLASENKLVLAGPLGKNDRTYRGIFILNTDNRADAEKWVASDPAVQAKVLEPEFYPWYGTAALQEIMGIHKKISK